MDFGLLTWCHSIYEGADGPPIVPVAGEVLDGELGDLVLDPAQQFLLGSWGSFPGGIFLEFPLVVPHWHGDGVMENKQPYQTEDQLSFTVYDICTVYATKRK